MMAGIYDKGIGTKPDIVEAYRWCRLLEAKMGVSSSNSQSERLRKLMSVEQIAEAERRNKNE